jgi:predicted acyltransferase
MKQKQRLLSLDVLRGITIAGMILVNNGKGPDTFLPLKHSVWNGLSLADLVFPFFLFMVGISTYISLRKFQFQWSSQVIKKILKRTCLILLIGWAIYWFDACCSRDFLPFDHLRIPGVLQRIAICYGIVSLIALWINHKWTLWLAGGLLLIYTFIICWGNGYNCDGTNILAIVDHHLFGAAHLYHKSPIDPEGLVGMIPSVAHTLIGFYCGKLLMEKETLNDKMLYLFIYGSAMIILGLAFSYGLPMNKRIWSPTLVLFTCGMACCLLALLMFIIDDKGKKNGIAFFVSFGVNPLFIYVMSELMSIAFRETGIANLLYRELSSCIPNGYISSLAYAVIFVLLNWAISYPLYKKKIYIKI